MFNFNKKREIIFHFNKKFLEDSNVPMWIIKSQGETFYVHHVNVLPGVGFSTKETPNNSHTKGSIKIKGYLTIKNSNNEIIATIS